MTQQNRIVKEVKEFVPNSIYQNSSNLQTDYQVSDDILGSGAYGEVR